MPKYEALSREVTVLISEAKKNANTEIWVDSETGVNYIYHSSGYSGGLTPLIDREGKPVITTVNKNS